MSVFRIPLLPTPQRFAITLVGVTYTLCFQFRNPYSFDGSEGDWIMDIGDSMGNPMVCGIPLVTGADLLAQYAYLGFPGQLWIWTDGVRDAVPSYLGLGLSSHLFFVTVP